MIHSQRHSASRTPIAAFTLAVLAISFTMASGQRPSSSPLASGGATSIYILEQPFSFNGPGSILRFPINGSADAAPVTTLTLPPSSGVDTFTVDASGQIYVVLSAYITKEGNVSKTARGAEIVVFPSDSNGAPEPSRTITGNFNYPFGIAVSAQHELYIGDRRGAIFVFSDSADGKSIPTRTIEGPRTQLSAANAPGLLALDASGFLYVSFGNSILVFDPSANGNVAPIRTFSSTKMNDCFVPLGALGIDGGSTLYAQSNYLSTATKVPCADLPSFVAFAPGADGVTQPLKTISGGISSYGSSFSVDPEGNIFALTRSTNTVVGYGPASAGSAEPITLLKLPPPTRSRTVNQIAVR